MKLSILAFVWRVKLKIVILETNNNVEFVTMDSSLIMKMNVRWLVSTSVLPTKIFD